MSHTDCTTMIDLLAYWAERQPDKTLYTFLPDGEEVGASLTYGEMERRVRQIAAQLQAHKLEGERAILLYPSGLEFIAAFFGCLYAGVIAVPAYPPNPRRSLAKLEGIIADAGARVILSTSEIASELRARVEAAPHPEPLHWLVTDAGDEGDANTWHAPAVTSDTIAFLQYTSGSTSRPKGVMVSHGNLLHNQRMVQEAYEHSEQLVMISWLPLYHDMGLIGNVMQPMYVGGSSVLMPPTAFVHKPARWLQTISTYRGTTSGAPNFAYDLCTHKVTEEQRAALDLSSWRIAYNGSEPIRAAVLERFVESFAPCGFRPEALYPCYGLAEATLFVSGGSPSEPPVVQGVRRAALSANHVLFASAGETDAQPLVSSGRAGRDETIRIVEPERLLALADGEIGEIWVASPSIAQGYWGQPALTEEIFRAHVASTGEGPFLRTGDLGFLHEGELFVTGRIKELLILHGRNYYPQDLEEVVANAHPALAGGVGAAFSIEGADEERLVLLHEVARSALRTLDAEEVIAAIRREVGKAFALPVHAVALLKPRGIPRTSSGKVQRYLCRTRFLAEEIEAVAMWRADDAAATPAPTGDDLARAIEQWLAAQVAEQRRIEVREIDPDQPFDRYGVDSLAATSIIFALEEKLSRSLPPALLWEFPTMRALAAHLAREVSQPHSGLLENFNGVGRISATVHSEGHFSAALMGESLNSTRDALASTPSPLSPPAPPRAAPNEQYQALRARGNYFYQQPVTPDEGAWVQVDGRRMLMMGSYGYLGLLGHPHINGAARRAIDLFGTGTHGVPLLAGTTPLHRALDRTIARFKRAEDAVTFSSGYVTNVAAISTLVDKTDVVINDALNHASIVDGCTLSQARVLHFRHNDMQDLERVLQQAGHANKLVIVDGVFSMEGDIAPLPTIVQLCRAHGARLMVDEAHSLGVLGRTGRGIEEHFGLPSDAVDIKMGTLSKVISAAGGYIAGPTALIDTLRHKARGFIFSSALTPAQAAAAKAAFEVIEAEPERVEVLHRRVERYLAGLRERGFNTLHSATPIVPIVCRSEEQTYEMVRLCQAKGLFVLPVTYPAVPLDSPRLRTTISAAHTEEDIDFALNVFEWAGRRCGLIG